MVRYLVRDVSQGRSGVALGDVSPRWMIIDISQVVGTCMPGVSFQNRFWSRHLRCSVPLSLLLGLVDLRAGLKRRSLVWYCTIQFAPDVSFLASDPGVRTAPINERQQNEPLQNLNSRTPITMLGTGRSPRTRSSQRYGGRFGGMV